MTVQCGGGRATFTARAASLCLHRLYCVARRVWIEACCLCGLSVDVLHGGSDTREIRVFVGIAWLELESENRHFWSIFAYFFALCF